MPATLLFVFLHYARAFRAPQPFHTFLSPSGSLAPSRTPSLPIFFILPFPLSPISPSIVLSRGSVCEFSSNARRYMHTREQASAAQVYLFITRCECKCARKTIECCMQLLRVHGLPIAQWRAFLKIVASSARPINCCRYIATLFAAYSSGTPSFGVRSRFEKHGDVMDAAVISCTRKLSQGGKFESIIYA